MLQIEISQAHMQKPEVYQTVLQLIQMLNDKPESVSQPVPTATPEKKTRRRTQPKPAARPAISPIVDYHFREIIKREKSLYFLTIIERAGKIDSDQITYQMQEYYPDFCRKSIGGITGAVKRWFKKNNLDVPYESDKDINGDQYFEWTFHNTEEDDVVKQGAKYNHLFNDVKAEYKDLVKKLRENRTLTKRQIEQKLGKGQFNAFIKHIAELSQKYNITYLEPQDNAILFQGKF